MELTRREALAVAASASAAFALAGGVAYAEEMAQEKKDAGVSLKPAAPAMAPLPFDPKKLDGISEKLIVSHWENNYAAAVKSLAKVREEIAKTGKDTPGFVVGGLRERELTYTNSMTHHELYFGNLGGDGKAAGAVTAALAEAFGGAARWEELFRSTGLSLGGGSGWTVLAYHHHTDDLRISWSSEHKVAAAFAEPLLVLDMYEHAYQMDYGAAAAKYVDAFFRNVKWEEVNRRYERALRMAKAAKG